MSAIWRFPRYRLSPRAEKFLQIISFRIRFQTLVRNWPLNFRPKPVESKCMVMQLITAPPVTQERPVCFDFRLSISILYKTSPSASGLQWLLPENTLGKKQPYVFSQCQAIHARSLIPCQDTPAVKFTCRAEITHPKHLTALFGGVRLGTDNGKTTYEQTVTIPAYLIAIAVGNVVSRPLGPKYVHRCLSTGLDFFNNFDEHLVLKTVPKYGPNQSKSMRPPRSFQTHRKWCKLPRKFVDHICGRNTIC